MSSTEVTDLARELLAREGEILRQGTVTAVAGQVCSVAWGNSPKPYPNQVAVRSYVPVVGDVVWGIRDGDDTLVLGPVTAGAQTVWHTVGATGEPAYQNAWAAWTDPGLAIMPPRFTKDSQGFVTIEGLAKKGALNSVIFTLPVGFRPTAALNFAVAMNDAFGEIQVRADGNVFGFLGAANTGWQSLSGVRFSIL